MTLYKKDYVILAILFFLSILSLFYAYDSNQKYKIESKQFIAEHNETQCKAWGYDGAIVSVDIINTAKCFYVTKEGFKYVNWEEAKTYGEKNRIKQSK